MKTPLSEIYPEIYAKFELNNQSGSHKIRAARYIIKSAIEREEIIPSETTVIEKTGGNFGFGLITACKEFDLEIELAVGLGFSEKKRKYLEIMGANLIGKDMLAAGHTPKEVIDYHLNNAEYLGKKYYFTDQFNNLGSLDGHIHATAPEIANQLKQLVSQQEIYFVGCAGTGASFTGISKGLENNNFLVKRILVEPFGCDSENDIFIDHRFEGMAVGVKPPFLKWDEIDKRFHVTYQEMLTVQREFGESHGFLIGNTSAACLHAAKKLKKQDKNALILIVLYDNGLWYDDLLKQ